MMYEYKIWGDLLMFKNIPTTINTKINDKLRISSAYRRYGNSHFEIWAWETYLWEGEYIKEEYDTYHNSDEVLKLHARIFEKYID